MNIKVSTVKIQILIFISILIAYILCAGLAEIMLSMIIVAFHFIFDFYQISFLKNYLPTTGTWQVNFELKEYCLIIIISVVDNQILFCQSSKNLCL